MEWEHPEQTPKKRRRREDVERKENGSGGLRMEGLEEVVTIMRVMLGGDNWFASIVDGGLENG